MKRFVPVVVGLIFAVAVSGCNSAYKKHEEVIQGLVKATSDFADALESVKDRETAKAAAVKINRIVDQLEELGKKAEDLPLITKRDDDKLIEKYKPEIKKQQERVEKVAFQAGVNSGGEPSFQKALERFKAVGEKLQKIAEKRKAK